MASRAKSPTPPAGEAEVHARLAAIVESWDDAIVTTSLDGTIRSWNAGAERLYGYCAAEMVGTRGEVLLPEGQKPSGALARVERGLQVEHFEVTRVRKDGSRIDVSVSVSPLRDAAGLAVGAVAIVRDVTEQTRLACLARNALEAERAAREEAERITARFESLARITLAINRATTLDAVLNAVVGGVQGTLGADTTTLLLFDEATGMLTVRASRGLQAEVGADVLVPVGRGFAGTIAATRAPLIVEDIATIDVVSPYLRDHVMSIVGVPLILEDRLIGVLHAGSRERRVFSDEDRALLELVGARASSAIIRARLYDAERAARAEAEAANHAKMQFLATMSHELRTPLNAIAGYAELIELGIHGPITDAQRDALQRLQRSQRHLLSLINDVLNFARIEAGQLKLRMDDVPMRAVVAGLEALVLPQLRAKALRYASSECGASVTACADTEKVQQILLNLLSNAIKFTPPGGAIDVSCDVDEARVHVRVRDSGIGIPADKLEHIFEPFVQLERSLTSGHEGTGLGLAISRDLARAMGGDLTAESHVGEGSTFTLTLKRG